MVAQLRAPPERILAPVATPAPAASPRPAPASAPIKRRVTASGAPEQFLVAVPSDAPLLPALEATPPVPVVQAEPVPEAAQPAEAASVQAAPVTRYKVSLPPSAQLTLDVARTDAKGTEWSGKAVLDWRRSGDQYRMTMVASVTLLVTLNLAELASEGTLSDAGIAPRNMTEKRRGRAPTATHFNADKGSITFSASEASVPLTPGAQDKATFMMQLAGIARADAAQLDQGVQLLVGEEKRADVYRFTLVGPEEMSTPMGNIATIHLARPPKPGSYNSHLDVWLAPGYDWYPVRIRNTEANGAVTTYTIRKIVALESGQ